MDTIELSLLVVTEANTILVELTYDDTVSVNNIKFILTIPLSHSLLMDADMLI